MSTDDVQHDAQPRVALLWSLIQTEFRQNQGSVAALLHDKRALRADVDAQLAGDVLWTINHQDVWHLLVDECGWTAKAYEKWCADAAWCQLLDGART